MKGQALPIKHKDKARIGGEFTVIVYPVDGVPETRHCTNLIVDAGIKHLGDI